MCGITGIIGINRNLEDKDINTIGDMTNVLRHRGPDYTGYFNDKHCALGNTRLKIIDLTDKANLPMSNNDKSIWMVYNGEVTNFRELKKKFGLERKYQFNTHSDTEVLLHLYQEIGIKFLNHLSGMFTICIYDKRLRKVYIARDFFGIRPLFYMHKDDRLFFASEIKSFLEIPGFKRSLNIRGIYNYFTLAYIPGRDTPFIDIKELRGGGNDPN